MTLCGNDGGGSDQTPTLNGSRARTRSNPSIRERQKMLPGRRRPLRDSKRHKNGCDASSTNASIARRPSCRVHTMIDRLVGSCSAHLRAPPIRSTSKRPIIRPECWPSLVCANHCRYSQCCLLGSASMMAPLARRSPFRHEIIAGSIAPSTIPLQGFCIDTDAARWFRGAFGQCISIHTSDVNTSAVCLSC